MLSQISIGWRVGAGVQRCTDSTDAFRDVRDGWVMSRRKAALCRPMGELHSEIGAISNSRGLVATSTSASLLAPTHRPRDETVRGFRYARAHGLHPSASRAIQSRASRCPPAALSDCRRLSVLNLVVFPADSHTSSLSGDDRARVAASPPSRVPTQNLSRPSRHESHTARTHSNVVASKPPTALVR